MLYGSNAVDVVLELPIPSTLKPGYQGLQNTRTRRNFACVRSSVQASGRSSVARRKTRRAQWPNRLRTAQKSWSMIPWRLMGSLLYGGSGTQGWLTQFWSKPWTTIGHCETKVPEWRYNENPCVYILLLYLGCSVSSQTDFENKVKSVLPWKFIILLLR